MRTNFKYSAVILFILYSQLIAAQLIKQKIDNTVYDKWYTLEDENIASNGKWVSFQLKYDNEKDTLVLKSTIKDTIFYLPKAKTGKFSTNSKWFSYYHNENDLVLLNLEKLKSERFSSIKSHQLDETATTLAMLNLTNQLTVLNLKTDEKWSLENVKEYVFSPDGKLIVLTTSNVHLISPTSQGKIEVIASSKYGYKNIVWNQNKGFAFLENMEPKENQLPNHTINYYDLKTKELKKLNALEADLLKGKSILKPFAQKALLLDATDDKIFFYINNATKKAFEPNAVEVWQSNSPLEYPSQQIKGDLENTNKLAVWWPLQNKLETIGSNERPNAIICPNNNFILTYNPLDSEPQFELLGAADFFITNLQSGETKLLLKNQSRNIQNIGASSKGNFLHYYKDKNWWIYNLITTEHRNISEKLPFSVENNNQGEAGPKYSFGYGAWSDDEKYIFIYDEFDIWKIASDGSSKERITKGREENKQYRIADELYVNKKYSGTIAFLIHTVNTRKGVMLMAIDANKSIGYYKWDIGTKLNKIYFNQSKSNRIKIAENSNELLFIEHTATKPPSLFFLKSHLGIPVKLFQTNPHYLKYETYSAELIHYTNKNGAPLQGVLYYPAGYNNKKKYPMIVYIYEKQSQRLHHYDNPTLYKRDGFSSANYLNDGYLVLYPDIIYEVGNPGISAADCVTKAVETVLKKDIVNEQRIGLIGH